MLKAKRDLESTEPEKADKKKAKTKNESSKQPQNTLLNYFQSSSAKKNVANENVKESILNYFKPEADIKITHSSTSSIKNNAQLFSSKQTSAKEVEKKTSEQPKPIRYYQIKSFHFCFFFSRVFCFFLNKRRTKRTRRKMRNR